MGEIPIVATYLALVHPDPLQGSCSTVPDSFPDVAFPVALWSASKATVSLSLVSYGEVLGVRVAERAPSNMHGQVALLEVIDLNDAVP